ncbi:MAG: glycosyltransferase [Paludibacter sp.]|nr:glycosyltransferase [Paludibacter sp.]
MKVIHFITSIDKSAGGTTVYMQLISKELKGLIDLVVVTGYSPNPVELPGIEVRFLDLSMFRFLRLEKEFLNLIKYEKPDIVHINGIWEPQTGLFQEMAQELWIKVVLTPHGMLEPYILSRHLLKKKIALALYQDRAIKNADYMLATAQTELDQFRKLGYTKPAVIIPNGIETADVKYKTEWMKVRNILFLSRVHPKKGLELLIEAVSLLENRNFKITIAGEGEPKYLESLKRLSIQYNVSHLFEFVGGIYGDDKWELYNQTDLFVLPTFSENFGIVVAEALATGIPVITTKGTPWQELETCQCGWWIDLTIQNLQNSLSEALNASPELLKSMGLRGQKLINEKYEIKAVAEKLKILYEKILL